MLLLFDTVFHANHGKRHRSRNFKIEVSKSVAEYSLQYSPYMPILSSIIEVNDSLICPHNKSLNMNILFCGDSYNIYLIKDWCNDKNGKFDVWDSKYKEGGAVCIKNNIKLGIIKIFGSKKKCPYHNGFDCRKNETYYNTDFRLHKLLNTYQDLYGIPNYIFYRTEVWDLAYYVHSYYPNTTPYNLTKYWEQSVLNTLQDNITIFKNMTENYKWAINILSHKFPDSLIGTHTIPRININHWQKLFHQFQNFIRYISYIEDLFIFDWMILLLHLNPIDYLKDMHHPNSIYSKSFSNIIINKCFEFLCFNW
jgi:hypothetical protein